MIYKYKALGTSFNPVENNKLTSYGIVLEILREKRIWLPMLESLNDPFEGTFRESLSLSNENDETNRYKAIQNMFDLSREYSVVSFTKDPDNLLLWSHYADSYSGVAIEFTDEPFEDKDVRYLNVEYERSAFSFPSDHDHFKILQKKSYHWEYEKEIRAVVKRADRKHLSLKSDAILSLIIGNRAYPEVALSLLKECKNLKIPIKVISGLNEDFTLSITDSNNAENFFARKYGLMKLTGKL